ncbi:MAG: YidH family protein [Pirellulaceae bacterium]
MVYSETPPEELTLRDHLARDRTVLANERTLLAYLRTGFGFSAGGVTLMRFFADDAALYAGGIGLIFTGGVISLFGILRFWRVTLRLKSILDNPRIKKSGKTD